MRQQAHGIYIRLHQAVQKYIYGNGGLHASLLYHAHRVNAESTDRDLKLVSMTLVNEFKKARKREKYANCISDRDFSILYQKAKDSIHGISNDKMTITQAVFDLIHARNDLAVKIGFLSFAEMMIKTQHPRIIQTFQSVMPFIQREKFEIEEAISMKNIRANTVREALTMEEHLRAPKDALSILRQVCQTSLGYALHIEKVDPVVTMGLEKSSTDIVYCVDISEQQGDKRLGKVYVRFVRSELKTASFMHGVSYPINQHRSAFQDCNPSKLVGIDETWITRGSLLRQNEQNPVVVLICPWISGDFGMKESMRKLFHEFGHAFHIVAWNRFPFQILSGNRTSLMDALEIPSTWMEHHMTKMLPRDYYSELSYSDKIADLEQAIFNWKIYTMSKTELKLMGSKGLERICQDMASNNSAGSSSMSTHHIINTPASYYMYPMAEKIVCQGIPSQFGNVNNQDWIRAWSDPHMTKNTSILHNIREQLSI